MTTKDKYIQKLEELIIFYEAKLSMGEIHSSYNIKFGIAALKAEMEKEELVKVDHTCSIAVEGVGQFPHTIIYSGLKYSRI